MDWITKSLKRWTQSPASSKGPINVYYYYQTTIGDSPLRLPVQLICAFHCFHSGWITNMNNEWIISSIKTRSQMNIICFFIDLFYTLYVNLPTSKTSHHLNVSLLWYFFLILTLLPILKNQRMTCTWWIIATLNVSSGSSIMFISIFHSKFPAAIIKVHLLPFTHSSPNTQGHDYLYSWPLSS